MKRRCRPVCRTVVKRGKKIRGRFRACKPERTPALDKRSLRWKQSGKAWVLVGCPNGKWQASKKRCRVGTRAAEVLTRA